MTANTVTFVIPHKGREEMLKDTLMSIAQQEYPVASMEIILVSQNSEVSEALREACGNVPFKVLFAEPEHTISASRNRGAKVAGGDYLAFLDADIHLSRNWLTACMKTLTERPGTKLVSAMQIPSDAPTPLEHIRVALSNAEVDCAVDFLPGRNLLLAKDTFYQVGQFPEHLITCEDYYFTDKVNQLGELFYTSAAQYIHIGEDKQLGAMFEKEIWRGQSNLASVKDRRIPLREWPSFIVPLAIPACVLAGLVSLIAGFPLFAVLCLVAAGLPVLAYSTRLYKLVRPNTSLIEVIKFYCVYFPARAVGTLGGIIKTFGTSSYGK